MRTRTATFYDFLRGISAYAVFVAHAHQILFARLLGEEYWSTLAMGVLARYAVLIFFLLSGYLITQSIRANIDRNGGFDVREYLVARIARIYPPLIGALVLCIVIWAVIAAFDLPGHEAYGLPTDLYRARESYSFKWYEPITALLMYKGMLNVDGPLWTLYIEFQMYLAALGVATFFGRIHFRWIWCGVGFLALTLAMHYPLFVAAWLAGAGANLSPIKKSTANLLIVSLLPFLLIVAVFEPRWLIYGHQGLIVQLVGCMVFVCVIFFSQPALNFPKWIVSSAGHSYSLYVIHWPLLLLVMSLMQPWMGASWWRTTSVAVVAVILIARFAYIFAAVLEQQDFYRRALRSLPFAAPAQIGVRS